jgi:hypothetical protein
MKGLFGSLFDNVTVHRNTPVAGEEREDAIVEWIFGGPPVPPQLEEEDRSGLVFLFGTAAGSVAKAGRRALDWWKGNDARS